MLYLIKTTLLLTIGIVAVFIISGLFLGMLEKATSKILFKKFGEKSIVVTGIIGTSIHELSHFVMCKIFLHKVTDMKLFSLKIKDTRLGYVSHSYDRKNPYQRIGNFFIGIAPIIFGTAILILLFRLFLPSSWNAVIGNFNLDNYIDLSNKFNIGDFISLLLKNSLLILKSLFTIDNLMSIKFWIFLFLAISISSHMSLSRADFTNSIDGILFILLISFLAVGLLSILGVNQNELIHLILIYNIVIIAFLFFALIFSLISYVIALLISLI